MLLHREIRLFIITFLTFTRNLISCKVKLTIEPAYIRAGVTLLIKCSVDRPNYNILWVRNGEHVGENCIDYKKLPQRFQCLNSSNGFTLIFKMVLHDIQGNWTCSHGSESDTTIVNITAPVSLLVTQLNYHRLTDLKTNILEASRPAQIQSRIQTSSAINEDPHMPSWESFIGNGSRSSPINLASTGKLEINSITIECSKKCSGSNDPLKVLIQNSTSFTEYPEAKFKPNLCSQLSPATSIQAVITCSTNPSTASSMAGTEENNVIPLVGLNRIVCASKKFFMESYQPVTPIGPNDAPDLNCKYNGRKDSACLFVLCSGPPKSLLTYGEKVAIGLSCIWAILLALIFLHLITSHSKLDKRNQAQRNLHPGEMELML